MNNSVEEKLQREYKCEFVFFFLILLNIIIICLFERDKEPLEFADFDFEYNPTGISDSSSESNSVSDTGPPPQAEQEPDETSKPKKKKRVQYLGKECWEGNEYVNNRENIIPQKQPKISHCSYNNKCHTNISQERQLQNLPLCIFTYYHKSM